MTTLKTGSKSPDQTYGTLDSTIWTTVEANTAIICACLPMLKRPLSAFFPRLFPPASRPGGSSGDAGNAAHRPAAPRSHSPQRTHNGYFRKHSDTTRGSEGTSKTSPSKGSSDDMETCGLNSRVGEEIPKDRINKTTDIKQTASVARSQEHSKDHVRSDSEAPLVADHSFAFP